MTLETVVDYFLVAGASFRNSDIWKRQHVSEEGEVRIIRGGRFGVGALAAFLLGDEICVRTRHFDRDELNGVEFTARIDEPLVELRRCSAKAGTAITVRVTNPDVMRSLRPYLSGRRSETAPDHLINWPQVDWYRKTKPSISYRWSGYEAETNDALKTKHKRTIKFIPDEGLIPNSSTDHPGWNSIDEPQPYEAILWKYSSEEKILSDELEYSIIPSDKIVVNGIEIQELGSYRSNSTLKQRDHDSWLSPSHSIERPSLAIYDPLGVCPVNLQRSSVSFERMGKDIAIGKSIIENYVRRVQELLPGQITIESFLSFLDKVKLLPGVRYRNRLTSPMCLTKNGVILPSEKAFSSLEIEKVFFAQGNDFSDKSLSISKLLKKGEALFLDPTPKGDMAALTWFRAVFGDSGYVYRLLEAGFPILLHTSECGILNINMWSLASKKGKVNKALMGKITTIAKSRSHIKISSGSPHHAEKLMQRLDELHSIFGTKTAIAGWVVEKEIHVDERVTPSPLVDIWTSLNTGFYLINSASKV